MSSAISGRAELGSDDEDEDLTDNDAEEDEEDERAMAHDDGDDDDAEDDELEDDEDDDEDEEREIELSAERDEEEEEESEDDDNDEEMVDAQEVTVDDDGKEADDDDDDDDDDDRMDEEEEVLTAVVLDDDDDNSGSDDDSTVVVVEAVEVAEPEPQRSQKKKSKKPSSSKKSTSSKQDVSTRTSTGNAVSSTHKKTSKKASKGKSNVNVTDSKSPVDIKKKSSTKSGDHGKSNDKIKKKVNGSATKDASSAASDGEFDVYRHISPALIEAASDARTMLRESVPVLPFPFAETQVRSLGRLCIQVGSSSSSKNGDRHEPLKIRSKFCTTSALYPVGFSCDRYEFSPVHGRVLKMRCSILDGRSIKSKQKEFLRARSHENASENIDSEAGTSTAITQVSDIHDGPIFRISWGRGLDEDPEKNAEYHYDPEIHSPPLIVNSKGKPKSDMIGLVKKEKAIKPEKGMRVKVRVDTDQYYGGNITEISRTVKHNDSNKKGRSKVTTTYKLTVTYDFGSTEHFHYPDPDLVLVMPGSEEEIGPGGELELTELNGKPIVSVVGESPLEAWGNALCRLGLIDELMLKRSLHVLKQSREEGVHGAKEKLQKSKGQERKDGLCGNGSPSPASSMDQTPGSGDWHSINVSVDNGGAPALSDDFEPPSERETALRERVQELLAELEEAKKEDVKAQILLANTRIRDLGPFLCNPFYDIETGKAQQMSWLLTAVRKEKTRMGSTGNKRKVVTALDLLERNDTFYNADIESIIEGLPGSELCKPYVFQAYRTGPPIRLWAHETEQKVKEDAEMAQRRLRQQQQEEKKAREAQLREEQELERELKKRKRDELRDERRLQKLAEEEGRKKARIDERILRLEIQIKDRLFKEAAYQREKVIAVMARSISKEYIRRRKAAESVAGQSVLDVKKKAPSRKMSSIADPLPSISKVYNEDTIRVWNFLSTFQTFFLQRGYIQEIPSLESLQTAVDCIEGKADCSPMTNDEAVPFLTELAVALCKPLAASLTRVLFASLIALNPALQKDFGAAFFNGVNATTSGIEYSVDNTDVLLPVNSMTWQEIARLAFLSDSLGEMGLSRQEAAHLLRGYRSAGHPNSKEAKRLRKVEDVSVAILRQKVLGGKAEDEFDSFRRDRIRVTVPCSPFPLDKPSERATPGKWPWSTKDDSASDFYKSINTRQRIGLLNWLKLPSQDYKTLTYQREQYMEDALKLKEETERAKLKEEDDEEDYDDDDDEENVANQTTTSKDSELVHKESSGEKIGKPTPYDDFAGDIPDAPEPLRRCLAVLRTVSMASSAEPFRYPVDPQTNPAYYDMVVRPMCLREAGRQLREACSRLKNNVPDSDEAIDDAVVQFGRNVRLIAQNTLSYANAGPTVIAAGSELLRIFERLLFDWVLAPPHLLPPLEDLDDDRCVEHHSSDDEATVLFCDGCEGKYNIARLDPPLHEVPMGDWYCPRCVSERWFGSMDPRIGKVVKKLVNMGDTIEASRKTGRIVKSFFWYGEGSKSKPSLIYEILYEDGSREKWPLSEVDRVLGFLEIPVEPIRCVQAVSESPGYGFGVDYGLRNELVPVPLNPNISDAAAQVALSSSVFRDTIIASATLLLIDPWEMTASEWLRLLVLLVMKCSSSDVIQNVVSHLENEAAEQMAKPLEKVNLVSDIQEILPAINIDFDDDPDEDSLYGDYENDEAMICDEPVSEMKPSNVKEEIISMTENIPNDRIFSHAQDVVVSDAGAFDKNNEMQLDAVESAPNVTSSMGINPIEKAAPFANAFIEKGKRQKAIEDCIVAYSIKSHIKPAVASLEEDAISPAVDNLLSLDVFQFSRFRCRRMSCHFCGLNDIALGLPLVRVPDEAEWEEMFAHAARSRRTHLIAEISSDGTRDTNSSSKLVVVKLKIGDELVSVPDKKLGETVDGAMIEFIPRSEDGFQDELKFRSLYSLPFVSGSLSAHECCAVAVHNARKESMVQKYKEHQVELVEKEAGMACGRTLEIGRDCIGRSYWRFYARADTLFVCVEGESDRSVSGDSAGIWHHYTDPASIASVIISLKNDPIVKDLCRYYPESQKLVKNGTWSDILMKRMYPNVSKYAPSPGIRYDSDEDARDRNICQPEGGATSFKVGDSVLVESQFQNLLWEARIVAVSKRRVIEPSENTIIDAYRVEYKGWGHRFAEWIKTSRVLQLSDERKRMQEAKFDEMALSKCGLPPSLAQLTARDYLLARDRARESFTLPDFPRIVHTSNGRLTNQKTFALMKASLLAIEAALPIGSIDNSEFGIWREALAEQWRLNVINAEGPATLLRCMFLLEDAIQTEWVKEDIGHLRSCLPERWKAVGEASASSVATHVILLDRSIKYAKIDRKRFAKKKKKK